MHDHETCERLMAAAERKGREGAGRLEYLATRCDETHGRLAATPAARACPEYDPTPPSVAADERSE